MGYLSANLPTGQQMNIETPLALFQVTKQTLSNITGNMAVGESSFILPSFCSMVNTLDCDQSNKIVNIQVNNLLQ